MAKDKLHYYFDYYGLNNEIEDGLTLTINDAPKYEHADLKSAKYFLQKDLSELENKNDNDVVEVFYETTNGAVMSEFLIYNSNKWTELDNLEILSNKFELLTQSETYEMIKKDTVQSWEDILENFKSFQDIDKKDPSQVLKYYSSFFHWYYYPEKQLFAPSKFLGYKDSTIETYDSSGSGGETQTVLAKYFRKLDKKSEEFISLHKELSQISKNNFGKDLNDKVINGTGGIYVPKN